MSVPVGPPTPPCDDALVDQLLGMDESDQFDCKRIVHSIMPDVSA